MKNMLNSEQAFKQKTIEVNAIKQQQDNEVNAKILQQQQQVNKETLNKSFQKGFKETRTTITKLNK